MIDWLLRTRLGSWYLEFLMWLDKKQEKPRYLTPSEMATIIRESNKIADGMKLVKRKVNDLVESKSKEEYDKKLKEIQDLAVLAVDEKDTTSDRAIFINILKQSQVRHGKDIVTIKDRAKMIEGRIGDMYSLQEHKVKRNMLREIRKLENERNFAKANQLRDEFEAKYGRK